MANTLEVIEFQLKEDQLRIGQDKEEQVIIRQEENGRQPVKKTNESCKTSWEEKVEKNLVAVRDEADLKLERFEQNLQVPEKIQVDPKLENV